MVNISAWGFEQPANLMKNNMIRGKSKMSFKRGQTSCLKYNQTICFLVNENKNGKSKILS